jgi:hypothetical protein
LDERRIGLPSRQTQRFSLPYKIQTGCGVHPYTYTVGTRFRAARGVKLTNHLHLVPVLKVLGIVGFRDVFNYAQEQIYLFTNDTTFRDVTPCNLVDIYAFVEAVCCTYHLPVCGDNRLIRPVNKFVSE